MVCMLATGYAAVAAEYSSKGAPPITQDYMEQVLTSPVWGEDSGQAAGGSFLEKKIRALSQALDQKIASLAAKAANRDVSGKSSSSEDAKEGDAWDSVTIAPGKTLKLDINAEVMIQKGGGTCVESAGTGLTDLSGGGVLSADETLKVDHRYIATTKGAGFYASSATTALVLGGYSLE